MITTCGLLSDVNAGPERCASGGGPTICVRFDNLSNAPSEEFDFVFDVVTNPTNPSVELRRGENQQGTLYAWRVWSKDAQGAPANLGSITSPAEYNYSVKIANPDDDPGAANLSSASLTPPGDHYSIVLPGSRIGGNLTSALVVQSDTIPDSGTLSLTIDGDVSGNITAPRVLALSIVGDVSGNVNVGKVISPCGAGLSAGNISGTLAIGTVHSYVSIGGVPGSLSIETMVADAPAGCAASVKIEQTRGSGNVSGIVTVDSMVGEFIVEGTVTSTGSVTVHDMIAPSDVQVKCKSSGVALAFEGTLTLEGGIKDGQSVSVECGNDSTGTLDLNNQGVAPSGSLDFHTGGPSTIRNGGAVHGEVEIGNGESPFVPHVFAGTATFSSIEAEGFVRTENCADLAGTFHVLGSARGELAVSGGMLAGSAILVDGDIAGPVLVWGCTSLGGHAVAEGTIRANADGIGTGIFSSSGSVTVRGFGGEPVAFNGDVCADNLSATSSLPSNFDVSEFGPNGKVCGHVVCGAGLSPDPAGVNKNRSLSSSKGAGGNTAIRVTMIDLQNPNPPNGTCCPPQDFHAWDVGTPASCSSCTAEACPADPTSKQGGCARWVGKPGTFLESQDNPTGASYRAARLQCTPFPHDWNAEGLFHVVGAEIVPSSTYELQLVPLVGSVCSGALTMTTARYGDVAAAFQTPTPPLTQPDAIDVTALVNKFKNVTGASGKAVTQLQPNVPELNADINALDIVACVDALKGLAYPFSGPCPCPSTVTCNSTPCGGYNTCPGGRCIKTCNGGANTGEPCIYDHNCPGGTCGNGGDYPGFCRDICGRCTP